MLIRDCDKNTRYEIRPDGIPGKLYYVGKASVFGLADFENPQEFLRNFYFHVVGEPCGKLANGGPGVFGFKARVLLFGAVGIPRGCRIP